MPSNFTAADPDAASGERLLTPLAAQWRRHREGAPAREDSSRMREHLGALSIARFEGSSQEMDAALSSSAIFDLGWRGKIAVAGRDRLRWLNGMTTNAVQKLPQDESCYSFILNPQGRIQGDCNIYRRADDLILDTARGQIPALLAHLKHYIIMDQVELTDVSELWTALGLAGPAAGRVLTAAGIDAPGQGDADGNFRFRMGKIGDADVLAAASHSVLAPRYELWMATQQVWTVWTALKDAGAIPAGVDAAEALRIAEGVPLYGIDLGDRDLPQETGQMRAINFTKGCYLGQEIVERIRSRGKVHRRLRQFRLEGELADTPFDLTCAGQTAGRITSAASFHQNRLHGNLGLGFVREEALDAGSNIEYQVGRAVAIESPHSLLA